MALLHNPLVRSLCLPQQDEHTRERASQLEAAQDAYRYTYTKPNLRGVAMVADAPPSEGPDLGWLVAIAEVAGEIVKNASMLGKAQGSSTASRQGELLRAIAKDGIEPALKHLVELVTEGKDKGPPARLAEYAELFQAWRLPTMASEHYLDSSFARMRVAGPNPAWMRRVDPREGLPDDFGVKAEHYRAAIGDEADSLEAALKEGRLFSCEYRQLLNRAPGCTPVPAKIEVDYAKDPAGWDAAYKAREAAYRDGPHPKQVVAPLALFRVPPGGGSLMPVAIQLYPSGYRGEQYPVFTPQDGMGWLAAKMSVNAADGNVHEAISHLGTTHLVQEAFNLAMHNCLAERHPLNRLLAPHFEGTALINSAADSVLVSPGGSVDILLMPTIGDLLQVSAQGLRDFDFNQEIFPGQLARRGVADAATLSDYPYRDDGLLVWGALEAWVRDYVFHHYTSDADVAADGELQAFVRQVGAYQVNDARGREVGGGIKGVGEPGGGVRGRAYLVQMITQIIWNGSAQHAAVNFPQGHEMAYVPLLSLSLMGALPTGPRYSEAELLSLLAVREVAHAQLVVTKLLASVYHTKLGHYPQGPLRASWFGHGPVSALEDAFQARLGEVEQTIDARNLARPAYRYMLPSEIPQSVNI